MATNQPLDPLTWNVPIVTPQGYPTNEFMRKWQAQRGINGGIPTDAAGMSALLDLLGAARGDVIYRGPTLWTVLAPGANHSILQTGGAAGDPSWETMSAALDRISATQGSIIYRNATGWVALTPGTLGYVLTTAGAGDNPQWAATTSGEPTRAVFFAEGLLASSELLGEWAFPTGVTFDNTNPDSFFTVDIAPTSAVDLPLSANTGAGFVSIGHIHYAAAALTGSLVLTVSPYTLTAHSRLRCQSPAVPDAVGAEFYGFIAGI